MGNLDEYLGFFDKVNKRIRNEAITEILAQAEFTKRTEFVSGEDGGAPAKLLALRASLEPLSEQFGFRALGQPQRDEEHQTWSLSFTDAQAAVRQIDWALVASAEYRQMMVKYAIIKDQLAPPFVIEYASKTVAEVADEEAEDAAEAAEATVAKPAKKSGRANREPVQKQSARELFDFVVEQGKKDYQVQRYKRPRGDDSSAAMGNDHGSERSGRCFRSNWKTLPRPSTSSPPSWERMSRRGASSSKITRST